MDFNYDLNKSLSKEIKVRKQDEMPENEKLEEKKAEVQPSNLRIPTSRKITADATAIDATIKQALLKGQTVEPEVAEKEKIERNTSNNGNNNPFVTVTPEEGITVDETANNIFITESIIEQNPVVVTTGGVGSVDDNYGDLVAEWNSLPQDADYQTKMNLIERIILAAQRDGNDTAAGTWTCYRFILRNNYRKEQYNNYLQQLAGNEGYENYENYVNLVMNNGDPGWYEDLGWNEQQWEISTSIMSPEDELDFEYFHRQLHFGGQIDPDNPMQYLQPTTTAEYQLAYVYCVAMIARYSTKILAMQVKLHDPDIINNSTLTNKINKDIAYYRQLLQGMIAERNRLAEELKYGHFENNGAFIFDVPDCGLVPGLTPPENNQPPIQYGTLQEQFEALEEEYNSTYGNTNDPKDDEQQIAKINELIHFAQKMVAKGEDLDYWQPKLEYWQNKLEQLHNGH